MQLLGQPPQPHRVLSGEINPSWGSIPIASSAIVTPTFFFFFFSLKMHFWEYHVSSVMPTPDEKRSGFVLVLVLASAGLCL